MSQVHILATVRKAELMSAALLVFRTLRVGFPLAEVVVWGNGLSGGAEAVVGDAARQCGARFINVPQGTVHDAWIEDLIESQMAPFWICDTDVVFWEAMPQPKRRTVLSGRHEVEFEEEWTRTRHMERLHTAVMWIDPGLLRSAMREWMARIPAPWGQKAEFPLVRQAFVPLQQGRKRVTLFYDTLAGVWQAGIGTPFTEEQNQAFDHLHCATYADVITLQGLRATHEAIYRDHTVARGMRRQQDEYYARRKAKRL